MIAFPENNIEGVIMIYDIYSLIPVNKIDAHQGAIQILTFNDDGTLLATCSEKGTLI